MLRHGLVVFVASWGFSASRNLPALITNAVFILFLHGWIIPSKILSGEGHGVSLFL